MKVKASWHFFATSHGKEPVDRIADKQKHHVWGENKANGYIVNDIKSFIKCVEAV